MANNQKYLVCVSAQNIVFKLIYEYKVLNNLEVVYVKKLT